MIPAPLAPLLLEPDLRRRPWGGRHLAERWSAAAARREPGDEPFGEAWLAGPASRILGGPHAGRSLADLAGEHGAALVGDVPFARYGARMPLLVKLLDAAEPLSVQVHPDDAYAERVERASGDLGKTEAWWVLDAAPDAEALWGFRRPVTREEVARAVHDGTLVDLLRRLPARAGDVIVNLAGTVHALGAGLLVYEVQQASDLTYRLYDHGRVGADGRPRTLHVERALDVAHRGEHGAPAPAARPIGPGRTELARTHAFVLERVEGAATPAWYVGTGSLEVLTHLGGAELDVRVGPVTVRLEPWATLVLPANAGAVDVDGAGVVARTWCPAAANASDRGA